MAMSDAQPNSFDLRSGLGGSQAPEAANMMFFQCAPEPKTINRVARVLVIEDHPFIRESVVRLINRQPDMACCGHADSIAMAPDVAAEQRPDLVLMDLRLKDGDSFGLLEFLQIQTPGLPIVMFSNSDELEVAERALRSGARGYVLKNEVGEEVLRALRIALHGKMYVSNDLAAVPLGGSAQRRLCGDVLEWSRASIHFGIR
jgi:DNA-binding response OmpR family regulator